MNIRLQIFLLAALLSPAWLTAGGCGFNLGDGRPLVVVVSGDMAGWIVPCGCTSNQSGGLPRRAAFIEQLRREANVVAVDVGGAPRGTSEYDRAKFEAIIAGEMMMGVEAHNLGAAEARLGADELRRLAALYKVPLLSANVFDTAGNPLGDRMRIVNAADRRLAFVGVLSELYATENIRVMPPRQTILEIIQKFAGQYDSLIVLAYLPEDELRQLAELLPEADVIVGGPTGQPIAPRQVGPVLLTSATNKGKFVAQLDFDASGAAKSWKGRIVELNDRFADERQQTANIEKFRRELAGRDFTPDQTSLVEALPANLPRGYAIAGNETCRQCHEDDCILWKKSKHSQAWNVLKEKGAEVDPECQRCHTTGYGLPGGFASVRRGGKMLNVGCESCHGPSKSTRNRSRHPYRLRLPFERPLCRMPRS